MTSADLKSELERDPFTPMRIHLVSGKTLEIPTPNTATLLQNALMVFRGRVPGKATAEGYDVVALRNIERIESLSEPSRSA